MIIRVTIKDDLTKKMAIVQARVQPALMRIVKDGLKTGERKLKESHASRLRRRTGRLWGAIKASRAKIRGSTTIYGQVPEKPRAKQSGWFYGEWLDRGVTLKPKKKKYMYIPMPDGTLRKVKEIVLRPRRWIYYAIQKIEPKIDKIADKEIAKIFKV